MVVVDASALIEMLLRTAPGMAVQVRAFAGNERVHVPHLVDLEVAQALRRSVARDALTAGQAEEALQTYSALRLKRYSHQPLLRRIWYLRHNLTAYDAAYIALAEALDCPLVTSDAKIAAVSGHFANIELID